MSVSKLVLVLSENWTLTPPRDLRALVEMAAVAEDAGFDAVMVSEHIVLGPSAGAGGIMGNPRDYALPGNQDPAMPWPSSLVLLSAIAAATTRLRLAACAVIAPLRHPLLLARELGTLDLLSEGRLVVQPTVSWHRDEYDALGVPFGKRGALLDEHLAAWEGLWRDTPSSFSGEHYSFADVYLEPKAWRPDGPRLWLGGESVHPKLLRRLVRYSHGFHPLGQPSDDDLTLLRQGLSAAGRDVSELELVGGMRAVFPDDDSPSALAPAIASLPAQQARGFTTFCIKPSQFIDDIALYPAWCREVVERVGGARLMRAEVAIVGNGVAGTACAMRLAREGIRPFLIGRGLPVDRPPLTKAALADGVPRLLSDAARLDERGVERLDGVVTSADLATCTLTVENEQEETIVEADCVVLATGLAYRAPPVPGLDGAFVNADPGAFAALGPLLTSGPVEVIVVGAGLIGTESAATLAQAGHSVTLLDMLERPLDRLHDPLPGLGRATLDELGVQFHGGVAIESATKHAVETASHGTLEADVILAATGGIPSLPPGLALEVAQLPLAVAADMLVPGHDRVYACGDLVLVPHARFGPMRFPHWDAAIGTGEQVADVIAGNGGPYDRLPYWWSDIGPRRLAEVGFAGAVASWAEEDGLHVGRDTSGDPVCVLVVDAPRRLREARAIVQDGGP